VGHQTPPTAAKRRNDAFSLQSGIRSDGAGPFGRSRITLLYLMELGQRLPMSTSGIGVREGSNFQRKLLPGAQSPAFS
jgi:hypothetical protein